MYRNVAIYQTKVVTALTCSLGKVPEMEKKNKNKKNLYLWLICRLHQKTEKQNKKVTHLQISVVEQVVDRMSRSKFGATQVHGFSLSELR